MINVMNIFVAYKYEIDFHYKVIKGLTAVKVRLLRLVFSIKPCKRVLCSTGVS